MIRVRPTDKSFLLCKYDPRDPRKIIGWGSTRDNSNSEFYDFVRLQDGTICKGSYKDYIVSDSLKKIEDKMFDDMDKEHAFFEAAYKLMKKPIDNRSWEGRSYYRAAFWLAHNISDEKKEEMCGFKMQEIKKKAKIFLKRMEG